MFTESNYEIGAISTMLNAEQASKTETNPFFSSSVLHKFKRELQPETFSVKKTIPVDIEDTTRKNKKKRKRNEPKGEDITDSVNLNTPLGNVLEDFHHDSSITENVNDSDEASAKSSRTVFVGNVPISSTLSTLTAFFKEFGDIESIRMRSVPVAGTKVDKAGDQNLVKKVCANTKLYGDQKGSYNAYVVFKEKTSAELSLEANNRVIDKRHLRVDRAVPTLFDPKRSVFIGSLSHYTDEEDLREHFAKALPGGHEDIESIRVIRDPESLLCKGIGYLLLTSRDAVIKALSLHQVKFKKRELRVTTCGKRTKRTEQRNKKDQAVDVNVDEPPIKKKQKVESEGGPLSGAARRLQRKNLKPKDFIGKKATGKSKSVPKKKKQLGGVMKKAYKASKNNKK